jgi:hypothetical protein
MQLTSKHFATVKYVVLLILIAQSFFTTPPAMWAAGQTAASPKLNLLAARTTCYGGATSFNVYVRVGTPSYAGPYTATTFCKDINIKFSTNPFPTKVTAVRCDNKAAFTSWKTYSDTGTWHVVASDVIDKTCFYLKFAPATTKANYSVKGVTAY